MKENKGYTVEQLEDLEIETELLLCGLLGMEDYPKQLEKRLHISQAQANDLLNDMNTLVFSKIKDELIKNLEQKNASMEKRVEEKGVAEKPKIQYLKEISKTAYALNKPNLSIPELKTGDKENTTETEKARPVLAQKMSGSFQIPSVKTEHTLDNITKTDTITNDTRKETKIDPYREIPE
jgi:hypothetical protein